MGPPGESLQRPPPYTPPAPSASGVFLGSLRSPDFCLVGKSVGDYVNLRQLLVATNRHNSVPYVQGPNGHLYQSISWLEKKGTNQYLGWKKKGKICVRFFFTTARGYYCRMTRERNIPGSNNLDFVCLRKAKVGARRAIDSVGGLVLPIVLVESCCL